MRLQNGLACCAAATVEGGATSPTLYKQMMASRVGTIHMLVAWFATLVTHSQDVFADPFTHAVVEHKILPQKSIGKVLGAHLPHIIDDAPVQLVDLRKTFMAQVGTGLFAADSTCAIQQHGLLFLAFQNLGHHRKLIAEGIGVRTNGPFKAAHFAFIVVAHVDHHCTGQIHRPIKLLGREVRAHIGYIKTAIGEAVGHQFGPNLHIQFDKGAPVILHSNFQRHLRQSLHRIQMRRKRLHLMFRHAHLRVNALACYINPAQATQGRPLQVERIAQRLHIIHIKIAVKRQGNPTKVLLHQLLTQ